MGVGVGRGKRVKRGGWGNPAKAFGGTHELMPDANNVLILCIKINLFFLTWPRLQSRRAEPGRRREEGSEGETQASYSSVYSCPGARGGGFRLRLRLRHV